MTTLARYVPVAAVLAALLVFAGCTTQTARAVSSRVSYKVSVVENSKNLHLTPAKTAEIRASALNYLKENGLDRGGEYFVKVNLTPDQPEDAGEWVVLRISSMPTRTYTLLAAYPGPDDFYPDDSYFYGYSNYGYPSFARYGYYDPLDYGYYNNYGGGYVGGGYVPPRDHNRPDHNKPGDRDDRPPGTPRTRWDGNRPSPDRNHSNDHRPRTDAPRTWDRDRSHDGNSGSSWSGHGGSHGASSDSSGSSGGSSSSGSSSGSSYSPPPAPAPEPPPRADPPQTERGNIYPAK